MKFKIGTVTFFPGELIRSPKHLIICLLLFIFFSNVLTMWGGAFSGRTPYGSSENFKTLNGEFEHLVVISKGSNTAEQALLALNNDFNKFKQNNPQYKDLVLYRTSEYYNISPWMFWKWYRYFGVRQYFKKYPFLNDKKP
ncbi:hypothetical protein [Pedobacter punctiformis]|uniref:Uncharacterized protein n=1 Tax=Pedobacter punctiformis TaxID=3004097 RepID=A0ABT4LD95_9SPHI|nr:hypothetical protein [Pedobacter sp. HCMS5-2]MCZ4244799.1 hypothetical protein [Pedobacter sp. HCMS5-2]